MQGELLLIKLESKYQMQFYMVVLIKMIIKESQNIWRKHLLYF